MKNVLVTGGAGFIGSNFIELLLAKEPDINIVNLDIMSYASSVENISRFEKFPNYEFIFGDIATDWLISGILAYKNIDTIVNFAAESHVDKSIESPDPFILTNIKGTYNLLEHIRISGKNIHFHQVSTDEVYGSLEPGEASWTEESPYKPNSPYSASKASADHLVRAYGHTYGLKYTISNSCNNYGEWQHPEKLIPLVITNALTNTPIPIYGNGKQKRSWIYVKDHCEAIYKILKSGVSGETYNVGAPCSFTNLDVALLICRFVDEKLDSNVFTEDLVHHVKDRPGHDKRYELNSNKIIKELGWKYETPFLRGLRNTVDWYIKNEAWWRKILEKGEKK